MESKADSPEAMFFRGRIVGMHNAGLSVSAISREIGADRKTVRKWIRKWEEEGRAVKAMPRSGRPRCTTEQDDLQIVDAARTNSITTAVKITRNLGLTCSVETTRRRLKEAGLHCHTPARKEPLTEVQRETRLGFALEYLAKDINFWQSCIFCDEKVFSSVEANQRHCWRPTNTRYAKENIADKRTCGRRTVSFFGWMWAHGPGELVKIEGTLNGQQYIEILEEALLPTVRAMAIPLPLTIYFVQDNSSIHKSRAVTEWLAQHPEIFVIDWPTKGCDLNPIEHLWAMMCQEWSVGDERTAADVERTARDVWESVRRTQHCLKLVNSMPKRLQAVIDANGGWTGY